MTAQQILEANLTWTGSRFEQGVQVEVDSNGRISRVGSLGLQATHELPRSALLPGMVSAHSHAFQRGLRGLGQQFPSGRGSFWSWREAMYELAGSLDESGFRKLVRRNFEELRRAGVTTVGEFHYLHHLKGEDFAFDAMVLEEAASARIRLVLIQVFYRTGDVGTPLEGSQHRFGTPSLDAFLRQSNRLARQCRPELQSMGLAAHSLRAASPDEVTEIYHEARRQRWPFHIHLEEQTLEVKRVEEAYGLPPLELVLDRLPECSGLTAIHCTQSTPATLSALDQAGGRVCLCPTTEADLGDGLPELPSLLAGNVRPCLGSDSNLRLSFTEEMRLLEWSHRLRTRTRGLVTNRSGRCGPALFELATTAGAESLNLNTGEIAGGKHADFIELDLRHPGLTGWTQATLLDAWIFGGLDEAIVATCVGGHWLEHRETVKA